MSEMMVHGYRIEPGAQLNRAHLAQAQLPVADLTGANLAGANLAGANLLGANLSLTNLAGASLPQAQLVGGVSSLVFSLESYPRPCLTARPGNAFVGGRWHSCW